MVSESPTTINQRINLRSISKLNATRRPARNRRPIHRLLRPLRGLHKVQHLLGTSRVDNHDLPLLAMRAGRAEHEDGVGARDHHAEGAHVGLAVLERDVPAVDAAVQRRAGGFQRALGGGVVAVAELELHDVADGRGDGVGVEGVLRTADDNGDHLGLSGFEVGCVDR